MSSKVVIITKRTRIIIFGHKTIKMLLLRKIIIMKQISNTKQKLIKLSNIVQNLVKFFFFFFKKDKR